MKKKDKKTKKAKKKKNERKSVHITQGAKGSDTGKRSNSDQYHYNVYVWVLLVSF